MQSHVDKGYQEQLHISSVTSCKNLWAIIMEAQTPYTKQVTRDQAQLPLMRRVLVEV